MPGGRLRRILAGLRPAAARNRWGCPAIPHPGIPRPGIPRPGEPERTMLILGIILLVLGLLLHISILTTIGVILLTLTLLLRDPAL